MSLHTRQYHVPKKWKPWVASFWSLRSDTVSTYRIFSDLFFELAYVKSGSVRWKRPEGNFESSRRFLLGNFTAYLDLEFLSPDTQVLFVKLYPWTVSSFFHNPVSDFINDAVDFEDIGLLTLEIDEQRTTEAFFNSMMDELSLRWQGENIRSLKSMYIENLTGELSRGGHSIRHRELLFKKHFGIPSQSLQKLYRNRCAVEGLFQMEEGRLFDLAVDLGYYDQSHFNHEMKQYAGMPPSLIRKGMRTGNGIINVKSLF